MTRRLITPLFLAVLAIGFAAPGSATGRIRCGATITKGTKLHHDLHCKGRTPITIGADHVILDLNGYEVERGAPRRHRSRTGAAIVNRGYDRVTITNGKVTSHRVRGVLLKDAKANHLVRTEVTVTGGQRALVLVGATHTIVRSNEIFSRGGGWPVVVTAGSRDNKIAHNNANGILVWRAGNGVGNRISFNRVKGGRGIYVKGGNATQTWVSGNRVIENDRDGILVTSSSTILANNRANRNAGHGINAVAGVTDLGGNRARGNLLSPQCINVICD